MSLPKLEHPSFTIKMPSNGKSYNFRPYTVKEQKILMMFQDTKDVDELLDCLKQLIEACCLTKDLNVDKLTYFDIEYVFLKIRSKSVGETSTLSYKCNNQIEDNVCGTVNKIEVDLESITVDMSKKPKDIINIDSKNSLKIRFPNLKSTKYIELYNTTREISNLIEAIALDIEYVDSDGTIYDSFSSQEIKEFINNFQLKTFEDILEFYINIPRTRKEIEFKCYKCGYTDKIVLSGITDFFE